jgi:hypothetical protein
MQDSFMDRILSEERRFDLTEKPRHIRWFLKPLTWIFSYPTVWVHHVKICRDEGVRKLKPPFILLCNHNAFQDFKVATAAVFPHAPNYVIAIDGYLKREWLIKNIGSICKRKFTNDISLVRNMKHALSSKGIIGLYPEARYSLCGTNAILPRSLGKLIKYLNVPVATLLCHGHHINSPYWALGDRKVHTTADYSVLFTKEQVSSLSIDEINGRIKEVFHYDDFAWQRDNKVSVKYPKRAEGLHKVLYQCPACKTEYEMESSESELICRHCGKKWQMTEFGELKAEDGQDIFTHIPSWYEWERKQVAKQISEGTYHFEKQSTIMALPNPDRFIPMGKCILKHDMKGFHVNGTYRNQPYCIDIEAEGQYSVHIEYDYLGKYGDLVDLNTLNDTFYIMPEGTDFSVTKLSLATEELFKYYEAQQGRT